MMQRLWNHLVAVCPDYETLLKFLAMILGLMLVCVTQMSWHWHLRHDNASVYYLGYRLLQGDVPYKDYFTMEMPLTILLRALGILLFGAGDIGHRIFYSAWGIFIIAATLLFFGKRTGIFALCAGIFYELYHLSTGIDQMLQREYLMLPFLLLAGHFLLQHRRYGRLSHYVMAGIMLGIAFMVKPLAAIYGICIVAVHALYLPWRAIPCMIFEIALGGLIIIGSIFACLSLAGGLTDFLEMVYYYFPIYQSMGPSPSLAAELPYYAPFILLACAISIPMLAESDERCALLLAACFYGLVHYFIQSFPWPHRLVPVRFFFILLCFYGAHHYYTHYGRNGRIIILALLAASSWVVSPLYWNKRIILDQYASATRPPREQVMHEILAAYRMTMPQSGKPMTMQIFDLTEGGLYYAATKIPHQPVTRCTYPPLFYYQLEQPYVKKMYEGCMSRLEQSPPDVIAISNDNYPFFWKRLVILENPRLRQLLNTRYILTSNRGNYQLYARKI